MKIKRVGRLCVSVTPRFNVWLMYVGIKLKLPNKWLYDIRVVEGDIYVA